MNTEAPLILVIEDSENIRNIMVETLGSVGYRVRSAGTAHAGATLARVERPDLILADVGLPDQDGAVAMSCLKDNPEFASVPLMIVSALPPDQLVSKMKDCGAADVLHKPFKRADLLERVKRLTATRVAPPAGIKPAPVAAPSEAPKTRRSLATTKACESCGVVYDTQKAICPHCAEVVGGFLAHSLTPPEDARGLLLTVLQKMESRWGLNSFASGWKLVDVTIRVVVAFVLISLAISTSITLQNAETGALTQLGGYRTVLEEIGGSGKALAPDAEYLRVNYQRLLYSAGGLIEGQTWDSWLHVWVLLALLAFVLTTCISSYRSHKESNQVRAALAFILTSQGRAFAEQLQRQRLEDETNAHIPIAAVRK